VGRFKQPPIRFEFRKKVTFPFVPTIVAEIVVAVPYATESTFPGRDKEIEVVANGVVIEVEGEE
jgi:hypothetical protein